MSRPASFAAAAWSMRVKTLKPAFALAFTAASNRSRVSLTEYLLGLVTRPASAAEAECAIAPSDTQSAKIGNKRPMTFTASSFDRLQPDPNLISPHLWLAALGRVED